VSLKSAFGAREIFWRNLLGAYSVGLDRFAPISVVACADHGLDLDLIGSRTGIRFYSLEENTRTREAPIGHARPGVEGEEIERELSRVFGKLPRDRFAIACPVPSKVLDDFVRETGFLAACTPFDIAEWLGEKTNWFQALDELRLPRLPGFWTRLTRTDFKAMQRALGSTFVAQLSRGVSGSGTAVIRSYADYTDAVERLGDATVWVAPFLEGPSLAVGGVVLEKGTAVGYPSVQLVGYQECQASSGAFCGNDYHAVAALPRAMVEDIQEQAERIGRWMGSRGFRGIFGLDFVSDPELRTGYAIDLNPRWLGSTAIYTQAEDAVGRIPLAALDLAARLGAISEAEALRESEKCRGRVTGSQLVLYAGRECWGQVEKTARAGVYRRENEAVSFVRDGIQLGDCSHEGEFLVTGGVPRPGLRILPASHLLRIYSQQPVLEEDGRGLLPWCKSAIDALYGLIEMKRVMAGQPSR
jgi:hypothetical protein